MTSYLLKSLIAIQVSDCVGFRWKLTPKTQCLCHWVPFPPNHTLPYLWLKHICYFDLWLTRKVLNWAPLSWSLLKSHLLYCICIYILIHWAMDPLYRQKLGHFSEKGSTRHQSLYIKQFRDKTIDWFLFFADLFALSYMLSISIQFSFSETNNSFLFLYKVFESLCRFSILSNRFCNRISLRIWKF